MKKIALLLISILPLFALGQTNKRNYDLSDFKDPTPQLFSGLTVTSLYKKGYDYYRFEENKAMAYAYFKAAARDNYPDALFYLGRLYEDKTLPIYSESTSTDYYLKALEYYRIEAEKGDVDRITKIGNMYREGLGIRIDKIEAKKWYLKGAEKGNNECRFWLGKILEEEGAYKDAFYWLEMAGRNGHPRAAFNTANIYEDGCIGEIDYKMAPNLVKAKEMYTLLLNRGKNAYTTEAKKRLKNLSGISSYTITERPSATINANQCELYREKASLGDANAQYILGNMYLCGVGVEKDYSTATEWFQKAANQGYTKAQVLLGDMYESGEGVQENDEIAFEWYQKAANQDYSLAQNLLGTFYEKGVGVKKNYLMAFEWYQKAANQEYAFAQHNLGSMYERGKGIEKDYSKAVEWYQKAIKNGCNQTKINLVNLQTKMRPLISYVRNDSLDIDLPMINRENENTLAIIIANEDYQTESKVEYAKNDGEVFMIYCNRLLGLPEKNIHYVPNATLNDLNGELDWIKNECQKANGEVSVIFYYAGHGLPDYSNGSSYLMPVDGNNRQLRTCVAISKLYNVLGSLPANKIMVFLDACFSGTNRNGVMLTSARGVAVKAKDDMPKGNMIVFSAAQWNETAYKYEKTKHGLFTYFLLKKIKESKGSVSMDELYKYIKDCVGHYSIVENCKSQTPTVSVSPAVGDSWKSMMLR